MYKYLESTQCIDWESSIVFSQAKDLAENISDPEEIALKCFEFVRDEITHSLDAKSNPITYKASDVLKFGTGYCYAKSHLLAALLRANKIPAGLCYQRLALTDNSTFCLHGLNAVYLEQFGWYRIDARGNKENVTAAFCPPIEMLAYSTSLEGEADLPEIWAEPLPVVLTALIQTKDYLTLSRNLPDIEVLTKNGYFPQNSESA